MNNLINLIKMHYTSVLGLKKSAIIIIFLAVFITVTNKDGSMLPFGAVLLLMLLNYSTLAYEDKSKANYLVYSLPVRPQEYILSKYIYGVINVGISMLFAHLIYIILTVFNMINYESIPISAVNVSIIIVGVIIVALVIPIALVVGFNKTRMILIFLAVIPVCCSNALAKTIPEVPDSIMKISLDSMQVLTLVIGLIITIISYFICSKLYCKKDINSI